MKSDSLVVALVQMTSVDSVAENVRKIQSLLSQVKGRPIDLICFPENALFFRINELDSMESVQLTNPFLVELGCLAQEFQAEMSIGSVATEINGALYNSSVWIDKAGQAEIGYQKMHLFDIELDSQKAIRESDVFKPGMRPKIRELKGWKIGESICYDLRFSNLYFHYALSEVDLILVPSAFLETTGRDHWEPLLRARAIESQCYVVASAQSGVHRSLKLENFRKTHGHSLVVDPWGRILHDSGAGESIHIHVLQQDQIKSIRRQIPMKASRILTIK